jgi:transposase
MHVKRNKTDEADAEAIAEAVTRPTMRFAAAKSAENRAARLCCTGFVLASGLRAHPAEFGIISPQGIHRVDKLTAAVHSAAALAIPREALRCCRPIGESIWRRVDDLKGKLSALHRSDEISRRPATILGVGLMTATALVSTMGDPTMLGSRRKFAACLGPTSKSHSSGGKDRLGRISKRGYRHTRHLLYVGPSNVIRFTKAWAATGEAWIKGLQERRPTKVVIIAFANKMARIAWAMMMRGDVFCSTNSAAA